MSTETVVRERGILMSAPMVRALLDGRKSQTRRVVTSPGSKYPGYNALADECLRCPYGAPGDRLWVRETWTVLDVGDAGEDEGDALIQYRADSKKAHRVAGAEGSEAAAAWLERAWEGESDCVWRPSIHMPRWASRLTLEITDVRVQRVQEISDADVEAEGVEPTPGHLQFAHRHAFMTLWDSLNANREGGAFSWDRNPWVWALTFRRVEVET